MTHVRLPEMALWVDGGFSAVWAVSYLPISAYSGVLVFAGEGQANWVCL